jgi:CHAT domain-containing protein
MHPIRTLLGDTRTLFLSPDGALSLIPFGVLVDEQNRYLVETYSIRYLSSGRELLRLKTHLANKQGPVLIADPEFDLTGVAPAQPAASKPEVRRSLDFDGRFNRLPGTAAEVTELAELLPGAEVLTGRRATEAAIKHVSAPSILHIATHGFFLPGRTQLTPPETPLMSPPSQWLSADENPLLRSGLALAGANNRQGGDGEDGILTALEASGLNLWGTKLVVLSACETGLGEVQNGEGVYGLRRAFELAGAESEVMSLWKVDDEVTRDLMIAYYTRLKAGEGRSEALRSVQLEMLRSKGQSHPYFWGSFIESGDWTNLEDK